MNNVTKNLPSVTIGIPAYNEDANIINLLDSIVTQKQTYFHLQRIEVLLDASTDTTLELITQYAQTHTIVNYKYLNQRQGKIALLNQLYKTNTSDYFLALDADIKLKGKNVINDLVKCFRNDTIGIVSGNNIPTISTNITEQLINTWVKFWYEVRKSINHGNSVHNIRSCILMMKKSLVDTLEIPKEIVSDSQYIYFAALAKNYSFYFCPQAKVLYKSPSNFKDFMLQANRTKDERDKLVKLFGAHISEYYNVPLLNKITAIVTMLFTHILFIPSFIIINLLLRTYKIKNSFIKPGQWKISHSTKIRIQE